MLIGKPQIFTVKPQIAFRYYLDYTGHVWAWGWGLEGELGNGRFLSSNTPVQVSNLSNIVAVTGSDSDGYALDSSGHVWAWGCGKGGQLGNGTTKNSSTPVQVSNLTNIVGIAVANSCAFALDKSGNVWAWGYGDEYLLLGNGTTGIDKGLNYYEEFITCASTPVKVSNLTNIVSIACGPFDVYALDNIGHVWAWGEGKLGGLGNGTDISSSTPVQVSNLSNIVALAGGSEVGYALDSSGHVWAWGDANTSQLGNGIDMLVSNIPVQVSNLSNIVAIASQGYTGYALESSGHVWAWGSGLMGALGNGIYDYAKTPVQSNLSNIVAIASYGRADSTYALDNTGHVWAWGQGTDGELGNGANHTLGIPVQVLNLPPN